MENKIKRFLSLLLAFVMVLGMFPAGHAHAEVFVEGNTINMNVGDTYTIENVTGDVDASNLNSVATIEERFNQSKVLALKGVTPSQIRADEKASEKTYVISNTRSEKDRRQNSILTATPKGDFLSLIGSVDSVGEGTFSWKIEFTGDNKAYVYYEDAQNVKQYLTIGGASASTGPNKTELEFCAARQDGYTTLLGLNGQYLNAHGGAGNERAGGHNSRSDAGAGWNVYEVVEIPAYTYTLGQQSASVAEGTYVLASANGGKYLSSYHADGKVYENSGNFDRASSPLYLKNDVVDATTVWTVSAAGDNYYVRDVHGRSLFVGENRGMALVGDNTVTLEAANNNWAIKANDAYLNNYGGVNSFAAGWKGNGSTSTSQGNQWKAFAVTKTPVGTTDVIITAAVAGDGTITIGDITYTIHVATDHEHHYEWKVTTPATCTTPGTETYTCSCGDTNGTREIPATGHMNTTVTGAVQPTLCEPGRTGTAVCNDCGETVKVDEEITQLPVATVQKDSKLVALNNCEYYYNGSSFIHTAADGTKYSVKPSAGVNVGNPALIPQTTAEEFTVTLHWGTGDYADRVQISGNGSIHFSADKEPPHWNKCGNGTGAHSDWANHGLYLFAAGGEGTDISGYTQVTNPGDDGLANGNYLIAAKDGDAWYVMVPSSGTHELQHVAQYTGIRNITSHTPVPMNEDVAPTFEETGLTGGERCSVCGKIVTPQTVVPAGYNTGVVDKDHINSKDGSNQGGENEGPASLALDDNFNTMWHSKHSGDKRENLWVEFELTAEYKLSGLYYKPRAGAKNGTITKYKILVSYDGETYVEFMSGDWTKEDGSVDDTWKKVFFEKPIQVEKVKLMAVESLSDQEDKNFASAAEIRLVGTPTAHEHTFSAVVTPATCLKQGFTTYTCSDVDCGVSFVANYVDALGHAWDDLCDTVCNNNCGEEGGTREPEHTYTNIFDTTCDRCKAEREDAKESVVGDKIINTTAEASSYHSGEAAYDKRPGSAVDGDYNTFWATDEIGSLSVSDAWLIVDLGSEQLINQAVITRRVYNSSYKTTGAMLDYIIEVSSDKETWTKVASGDIDSTGSNWTIRGATVTFDAVEARYVRLTATKTFGWDDNSKNKVMSCAEFEVFKAVCAECTENEAVLEKQADGSYKSVVYCADCGREIDSEDVIVVETFDVKLEAEIKLEYTVSIPASIAEGAYVTMTKVGGYGIETETIAIDNSKRIHRFAMGIASGEMTAPITIRVYDADGTELELYTKSGKLEGTATKTVVDYAKKALGEGSAKDDTTKALVRAMLVYGGYAQAYFQENFLESVAQIPFADMNIDTTLNVDVAALDEYKNSQTLKDAKGVKASSITTSVDSYTAVRVYLTVYEGQIGDYTFTLTTPNGTKEITPVLEGNRYYVDIPDIASGYIDYKYTITITNKETAAEVNVITASVLGYVRSVLNNSESSAAKKDLVKALYLYNQAADAKWPNA